MKMRILQRGCPIPVAHHFPPIQHEVIAVLRDGGRDVGGVA